MTEKNSQIKKTSGVRADDSGKDRQVVLNYIGEPDRTRQQKKTDAVNKKIAKKASPVAEQKIAVVKTGGKQYKVTSGQIIKVEKLKAETGDLVKFDTLMIASADGRELKLGSPLLKENVEARVLEHLRDRKVKVVKYKNKIRYKKVYGHRQPFTRIEIAKF